MSKLHVAAHSPTFPLTRRRFLHAVLATGFCTGLPPWLAAQASPLRDARVRRSSPGRVQMDIAIRPDRIPIAGGIGSAITLNDTIPGPIVELYEGHEAVLRVTNHLPVDSSIHWHGILLPFEMDGVPGVTFPGISPGATFEAQFSVRQSGTYWYHSHSGLQEQSGSYGPIVIHPKTPDPYQYQRDYVVMLSDWTFEDPHDVLAKLKKMSHYYNFSRRTVGDLVRDASVAGVAPTVRDRLAWGDMRMSPSDIADVTAYTYTYLMNGVHPDGNWTGVFAPGERVRLRFINGSAMTFFNVRIPGLPMTVVAADGPNIEPVETDEFQIGVAETFDVIVEPNGDQAYTIFAESMDRSGFARGTLAPRQGMTAAVPELRRPPLRTMVDMGMGMDMNMPDMRMDAADADPHGSSEHEMHGAGNMEGMGARVGPVVARHNADGHGPGNTSIARMERDRLGEPGAGLENVGHRVLVYRDLRSPKSTVRAIRAVDRDLELHLTGNMDRYMWSFDGEKFSEVDGPIELQYGELVRLILVNDTMMEHPIHLHGMFMQLENGQGDRCPLKHTISVKPAERVSLLVDANEPGRWAFHCHLLYHMEMGMFRVVRVNGGPASAT